MSEDTLNQIKIEYNREARQRVLDVSLSRIYCG